MDAALSSFDESDSLETDVNCFYDLLHEQLDRIAKCLLTHKKNPIMAGKLRLVQRNYSS